MSQIMLPFDSFLRQSVCGEHKPTRVHKYNPETRTWKEMESLNASRNNPNIFAMELQYKKQSNLLEDWIESSVWLLANTG